MMHVQVAWEGGAVEAKHTQRLLTHLPHGQDEACSGGGGDEVGVAQHGAWAAEEARGGEDLGYKCRGGRAAMPRQALIGSLRDRHTFRSRQRGEWE